MFSLPSGWFPFSCVDRKLSYSIWFKPNSPLCSFLLLLPSHRLLHYPSPQAKILLVAHSTTIDPKRWVYYVQWSSLTLSHISVTQLDINYRSPEPEVWIREYMIIFDFVTYILNRIINLLVHHNQIRTWSSLILLNCLQMRICKYIFNSDLPLVFITQA